MANKRKSDTAPEKKDTAENKSFYLAEAFFGTGDSEQSMNALVPKLLEAKTQDEIEAVYRQHIVDHRSLGKDVDLLEIAIRDYYSQQESFEDPTALYAKWLYYAVQSASALLDLYRVCLRVARDEASGSAVVNIMDMLCFANKAFEQMLTEVKNKEYTLREVYDELHLPNSDYHSVPDFPLVFFFREFQENPGKDLQEKYGFSYYQSSKGMRFEHRYWAAAEEKGSKAAKEIRELLWGAATNSDIYDMIKYTVESWRGEARTIHVFPDNYADDLRHMANFEDKWLAKKIHGVLDRYTEKRLSNGVILKVDSANGRINAASECIDTALFLWIITQIHNTEDYRICKICGQVFTVGAQKTRQYCYSHPKAAIDYFNRKLHKKK